MSYRVEVARLEVTTCSLSGARGRIGVFLRVKDAKARFRETLGERINDPEVCFIPVQDGDRVELLSLRGVAFFECEGALPEVDLTMELGGWREPATLVLLDGTVLEGDLIYSLPHGRHRVSDLLNQGVEFLLLYDGTTTRYVSRHAIARVRTGLDDQLPHPPSP